MTRRVQRPRLRSPGSFSWWGLTHCLAVTHATLVESVALVASVLVILAARAACCIGGAGGFRRWRLSSRSFRMPVSTARAGRQTSCSALPGGGGGRDLDCLPRLLACGRAGARGRRGATARGPAVGAASPRARPGGPRAACESLLLGVGALYTLQAIYSGDLTKALENLVFFYIPFGCCSPCCASAVDARAVGACLAWWSCWRWFAGVGFIEYARKPPLPEPQGGRGQSILELLPRELAVLRPEHLRALSRARDDRPREALGAGEGAAGARC